MKIVVCIRQGLDGEINPFDACAYEAALCVKGAEITLLSMGPASASDFLLRLTRLGARRAILLSDRVFAGADTLATAYTLSLAIKRLKPDLIFCGRQTLVGDTAQTAPMLSVMAGYSLITNVMKICEIGTAITCETRDEGVQRADLPTLITVERINTLRLPSILSRLGEVETWDANTLGADLSRCGLVGSPTRVLKSFENVGGRRTCKWINASELRSVIEFSLEKDRQRTTSTISCDQKLNDVWIVGDDPREFAKRISNDITVVERTDAETIAAQIKERSPRAVLWGSDAWSKRTAAQVAAMLSLGLCADCTALETDGERLFMYRPALSGSVIAKIESLTLPAMATVRTQTRSDDLVVTVGYGARETLDRVRSFAEQYGAELGATRKMVDQNLMPYLLQIGLTGKTVSPPVYLAIGVSGAVHHIVGMQQAGTVIAINPDRDAPIFNYADYGILASAEEVFSE